VAASITGEIYSGCVRGLADVGWEAPAPVLAGCLVALALFAQAFWRLRQRGRADHAGWDRAALFVAAVALTYLALASPLDGLGDRYLISAHMLQHVAIGDLAPALGLVALRGPLTFFLLPAPVLSSLAGRRWLRTFLHRLTGPWVALTLWIAAMWAWHVPRIYDYAATHPLVHDLEHLSFVLVGVLVWNLLIDPARTGRLAVAGRIGLAVAVFAAGDPLTAGLISSGATYPHYVEQAHRVFGLTPHVDQVLAGVVMLVEQIATLGTCCAILLWPHLKRAPLRDESVQL
jgi:cytochrome c oxidase assembly factor CtaG